MSPWPPGIGDPNGPLQPPLPGGNPLRDLPLHRSPIEHPLDPGTETRPYAAPSPVEPGVEKPRGAGGAPRPNAG